MKARFLILVTLVFIAVVIVLPSAGEASDPIKSVDLVFTAEDFETGLRDNLIVTSAGLSLAPTSISGRYISPVVETPIPFNAIVPHWLAEIPYANSLRIMLRTGVVGGAWGEWYQVFENHDWMDQDDEESVGQMFAVPADDVTHDKLQYAVFFSRYTYSPSAVLQQLRYTIIDSTDGPTVEEMLEQVSELEDVESPDGRYPKPTVIPRSIWCNDPACNYSDDLNYESVSHLIVHHTVSSNSSSDWAAIVRAIWYYHTFTRGWGDIGYNYLVDMNGVLYEGHNGGDDVIGTHAADANKGSMALSFIGTFTEPDQAPPGITPPPAMLNSAVELFAWKADQKNIDVFSASRLPNVDWGLPNLMGHRDVYRTTACPGDQAHDLVPWLREEVANRIGFVSPYIYVDELMVTHSTPGRYRIRVPAPFGVNGGQISAALAPTNWKPMLLTASRAEPKPMGPFTPYPTPTVPNRYRSATRITSAPGWTWEPIISTLGIRASSGSQTSRRPILD